MSTDDQQRELSAALLAADPVIVPELRRLVDDPGFEGALRRLGTGQFAAEFSNVTNRITGYNDFLRRERRLWSVKLGTGRIPFKSHYQHVDFDYIGAVTKGDVANVRPLLAQGVNAQVQVLEYTRQHGFDYIRGEGPPAWAIWVSEILAAVGISISAWVVLAVIAGAAATLVLICAAHILPVWLQDL